ncbi:MAG TPA: tRNA pseudouridine(38-40) synthase TruA [Candidatus Eisenbacteria bacterium]|nr:tRNA pseudouridine(38-40) synthase TruA [Candidatus Eisenbacteria bacterium]
MASDHPVAGEPGLRSFRLALEYDGTDFHGWQVQRAHRSVQGDLEDALRKLSKGPVRATGAGRTDAGCHAAGQVASVTLMTRLHAERLRIALNALLPRDVRVIEAAETDPGFHARFDAMRRAYRYLIAPGPAAILRRMVWVRPVKAGVAVLNEASRPLLGTHDFTSFSKRGTENDGPECRVTRARWSGRGGRIRFDIESDRFLYSMVRRIVSTVVRAAEDGGGARAIRRVLEAKDRGAAAPPAPAHGLYLMRVRYPKVGWIPKEPMDVRV